MPSARTLLLALLFYLALAALAFTYLPTGADWELSYRPAAQAVLRGQNPYTRQIGFYNPPWITLPLALFAFLPLRLGYALLFAALFLVTAYTAVRFGATPLTLALFLLARPVLYGIWTGQIEPLIMLGFLLPPQWALFLVLAKPQIGIAAAGYWLVEAWRAGGWRRVVQVFAPVTLAFGLSFVLYGPYFLQAAGVPLRTWNESLFPWSLPLGVLLLGHAVRTAQLRPAIAASPFLASYVAGYSWSIPLLTLLARPGWMALAWLASWVVWIGLVWAAR